MSVETGSGVITNCVQTGSDVLSPSGVLTATCAFAPFGSHPATFTVNAPVSATPGAATGWEVSLTAGAQGTGFATTTRTLTIPNASQVLSITISLRAPAAGGVANAPVSSTIAVSTCNQGTSCRTGSTTIGATLAAIDLSRVTMTCTPSSPASIVRLQRGAVTCTIRVPSDFGATSVALRTISLPAAPAGWDVTATPTGTIGPGGSVTISPARTLAAGQSWSFTFSPSPACSAANSASWSITSRVAAVTGTNTGPDVNGPGLTYTANAVAPAQTVSSSIVSTSLDWSFPFSFDDQSGAGTLTYRVTGAGCSGWSVSVASSPFTYIGSSPGSSIPANNLALTSAESPSSISGNGTGVASTGVTGGLGTARKVISAQPGTGNGTYQQDLGVSITVPGGTTVGTYRSTITITTATAP